MIVRLEKTEHQSFKDILPQSLQAFRISFSILELSVSMSPHPLHWWGFLRGGGGGGREGEGGFYRVGN